MPTDAYVQQIIRALDLRPLPAEGGLFRQTWQSPLSIPLQLRSEPDPAGQKPLGTAIFYLLTAQADSFSALHRLPVDEIWHFYLGDPLEMTLLYPDGSSAQVILGQDVLNGQQVQFVAPGAVWQGTRLLPGGRFALVGTTMTPGFTPDDYEGGLREDLLASYPNERQRILALTRA
jgi:uncharacterized protein